MMFHFSAGRTLVNSDAVVMKRCDEHDIAANDGKLVMHARKIARFGFVLSTEIPLIDDDGIRDPHQGETSFATYSIVMAVES